MSSSLVLSSDQLMIQQIHDTIRQELGAIHVEVLDESSSKSRCEGGAKLKILVVSEQFTNVSLLQRHRKIKLCKGLHEGNSCIDYSSLYSNSI